MVGHESVDPKPQAKADLVTGVILVSFFSVLCLAVFFVRLRRLGTIGKREAKAKKNKRSIETPPRLRRKGIRS